MSQTPGRAAPSCLNGQHTTAILSELGYSSEEIRRLHEERAVFSS
jgi:crotonobetainyl-CoA:carnitine CoA-transferase CaiB-like acyl-CoA transferase